MNFGALFGGLKYQLFEVKAATWGRSPQTPAEWGNISIVSLIRAISPDVDLWEGAVLIWVRSG